MSDVVPKEKQTAYQRWEMPSFGDERPAALVEKAAQQTALSMQQLVDVQNAKITAKEAGYAEGFALGQKDGLAAGRAGIEADMARLTLIVDSFTAAVADIESAAAQDILDLTMDIARAMLKNAIAVQPELILPIIKAALQSIPVLQMPSLAVNPADAELVRGSLGTMVKDSSAWEVIEDEGIEPGGCRIDTATNQVDMTMQTRWEQINTALGQDKNWLANVTD